MEIANYDGTVDSPRGFWYGVTTYLDPTMIGAKLTPEQLPEFLRRLNTEITLIGRDTYSATVRLNTGEVTKCIIAGPHSGAKEPLERMVASAR